MSTVLRTPEQQICQRYRWFELAAEVGSVTVACERCGISRKTYYKWQHRLAEARGERQALLDLSRRPHWPRRRVKKAFRRRLLHLRQRTRLGPASPGGTAPSRRGTAASSSCRVLGTSSRSK